MRAKSGFIVNCFLWLSLGACAFAQSAAPVATGTLSGTVIYVQDKLPIRDSYVLIRSSVGATVEAKVDDHGRYSVALAPGLYDVMVGGPAFAPLCKSVEIVASKVARLDWRLRPDEAHLQGETVVPDHREPGAKAPLLYRIWVMGLKPHDNPAVLLRAA